MKRLIQIGANVGNDDVSKLITIRGYWALLVEPNPFTFEVLKKNYDKFAANIVFENVAIADFSGKTQFFIDKENDCSPHASLSSEFQAVHKHINLLEVEVSCLTLTELMQKHDLIGQEIDQLIIDAEGYDGKIILSTNFRDLNIKMVEFEHYHLDGPHIVNQGFFQVVKHLNECGYDIIHCGKRNVTMSKSNGH